MKKIYTFIACALLSAGSIVMANENSASTYVVTTEINKDIDGEWTIKTLKGKEISTRERAFLYFSVKDSMFYGNGGCNAINGAIHAKGGKKITLDNIITTMMECHNATSERTLLKALTEVSSYKIETKKDGIRYMTLLNAKGSEVMCLKNHDIDFLNGAWTASMLSGESVTNHNVRIVIDVQEMRVHGNSGCNIINGTLFIDPNVDWGVEFQQLISTRRMCPDIHIETALLVALEETQTCKKINDNEIGLYDADGKKVAQLKRLNLR